MGNAQLDANGLRHRLPQALLRLSNPGLFLVLIISIAWWLLTRPYQGIWHDGIFYTVQALRHLHPERYAQDVFFLYGSQDDYSFYSVLQAWLINIFGIEGAFLCLTLAGAALWLYALLRLLARWLPPAQLVLVMILVLSADAHYGGFDLFAYGERFASPRIFSEALVLLSLSLWFEDRRVIASFVLAGAALIHLLIALAGIGVFIWSVLAGRIDRPAVLWLVLLGLGLLGMMLSVWSGLSPQLDPLWRQLIAQRSPFIFPRLWESSDWLKLALDAMLLWMAFRFLRGEGSKLAGWVLAVLALAVLLALAGEVMGVQLAVAAQVLRVQWLAHLLAIALIVPLCLSLWNSANSHDRLLAVAIGSSLVFPFNSGGLVLPVAYGLYRWARYRMPDLAPGRGFAWLIASIPLCALVLWLYQAMAGFVLAPYLEDRPAWLTIFIQAPVALGIFVIVNLVSARWRQQQLGSWVYAASFLLVGLWCWDASKPWKSYDEPKRNTAITAVQSLIPEGAVVYWESGLFVSPDNRVWLDRGLEQAWFWLQRSHYASFDQAAGNVFYRQTALELDRRIGHLRHWAFRDGNLEWKERRTPAVKMPLSGSRIGGLCSDPVLDFVITDTRLPSARLAFEDPLSRRKFAVYACESFRQGNNG